MSKYAVIIEDAGPNLCAYVPDLGLRFGGLHR